MTEERRVNSCDSPTGCQFATQIAREASEMSSKKVFAILGVDLAKPESVEEFREDLRFGGKLRRIAERGVIAFIGVVATAAAVFIVEAVRARL